LIGEAFNVTNHADYKFLAPTGSDAPCILQLAVKITF